MNAGELTAKLTLNTIDFDEKIAGVDDSISKLAKGITGTLGTVTAAVGAAVAAAGVAVGKIINDSAHNFADYEQLVGGVETLFKDSADVVQNYAKQAYKTAGISANQYMEQATAFSARLIQSLEGDTEKAAVLTDQAIIDMADNANKMGTDLSSIQNAYQGFAKANYTMLDNLKLGYGGTQEEMKRLLKDAEKLTGIHYNIENFSDIIEAIHAIQKEMGITGTTAEEAASTVSGSWNMVKASWQDLLTSIAGGGKEMSDSIKDFTDSIKTYAKNVLPVIQQALYGVGDLIKGLAPIIGQELPGLIETLLPQFLEASISLVQTLIEQFPTILQVISDALPSIVSQLMEVVVNLLDMIMNDGLPKLLDLAIQVVLAIGKGIANNLNRLTTSLIDMVFYMVDVIVEHLPEFITTGLEILLALVNGIVDNFDKLQEGLVKVVDKVIDVVIEATPKFIELGVKIIEAIAKGILQAPFKLIGAILKLLGFNKQEEDIAASRFSSYVGARASGGPVTEDMPYLVGEQGPELFVPHNNGHIISDEETADLFSGGRGDIYITIQGDVYDDERSMREKMRDAVLDVIETELAYG